MDKIRFCKECGQKVYMRHDSVAGHPGIMYRHPGGRNQCRYRDRVQFAANYPSSEFTYSGEPDWVVEEFDKRKLFSSCFHAHRNRNDLRCECGSQIVRVPDPDNQSNLHAKCSNDECQHSKSTVSYLRDPIPSWINVL